MIISKLKCTCRTFRAKVSKTQALSKTHVFKTMILLLPPEGWLCCFMRMEGAEVGKKVQKTVDTMEIAVWEMDFSELAQLCIRV